MREIVPSVPIPMRVTILSETWGSPDVRVHHFDIACSDLLPTVGERIRLVDDHNIARVYSVATISREYNIESGLGLFDVRVSLVK